MSTTEAVARACMYAATFAFCANEIRKDRTKMKKREARLEKRKMMKGRSKAEQRRAIMDEDWDY